MPARAIEVYPRIHVTLIGMSDAGYRRNGGIGFAVDSPSATIEVNPSDEIKIDDHRDVPFPPKEIGRLGDILTETRKVNAMRWGGEYRVTGALPTHSGFGSTTAIRLACIELLYLVNDCPPERTTVIRDSRRGGTSGIGINTYFDGGLIFDAGQPTTDQSLRSSTAAEHYGSVATQIARTELPDWGCGIGIPANVAPLTEGDEHAFFSSFRRLAQREVADTLYHCVHGIYAGAADRILDDFSSGLSEVQKCAWKSQETALYGSNVSRLIDDLTSNGARAAGMSSLGPAVYFFSDSPINIFDATLHRFEKGTTFSARPRNSGRTLIR